MSLCFFFTEVESPNEFYPVPPPYSVATSLPTYDEAEKAKAAALAAVAAEAAAHRVSKQIVLRKCTLWKLHYTSPRFVCTVLSHVPVLNVCVVFFF